MANIRNYKNVGGSTMVISGDLNVPSSGTLNIETGGILNIESGGDIDVASGGNIDLESGGYIAIAEGGYISMTSGGHIAMPVQSNTSADKAIPNYGLVIINSSGTAGDVRKVAAPTRAGLVLHLVSVSGTTIGINVCVASASSNVDITIETTGVSKPIWEIIGGSTQALSLVSSNTSQWYVVGLGAVSGTLSTDGTT